MKITPLKYKPFTGFPTDAKSLLLPFKITDKCPKCGKLCVRDLSKDDRVEYLILGQPVNLYAYCEKCETEWDMTVRIEITVTPWNT